MSLPHQRALYKEKFPSTIPRLRPTYHEGRFIRTQAILKEYSSKKIADNLNVSQVSIHCVIHGKRRSARIESEIARILGKESWNDVVLEARSEVQKKPVKVIKQEIERQIQEKRSAMSQAIENNAHDAIFGRDWSAHLKAYADEQAAAKGKRRGA